MRGSSDNLTQRLWDMITARRDYEKERTQEIPTLARLWPGDNESEVLENPSKGPAENKTGLSLPPRLWELRKSSA